MRGKLGFGIMLAVLMVSTPLFGAVLVNEDFSGFSEGMPAQNTNIAGSNGGYFWWYGYQSGAAAVSVVDHATYGKVLDVGDWSTSSMVQYGMFLSDDASGTTEKTKFSYDICFRDLAYNSVLPRVISSSGVNGYLNVNYPASGADVGAYAPGYTTLLANGSLANDTWYRFEITMPDTNETIPENPVEVKVFLRDQPATVLYDGAIGSFASIAPGSEYYYFLFTQMNATATPRSYYVDNITVETVPEPATMCLLGLGGLAGLLRRRRK